jgi:predicted NBD/HSP70 family sugar kinase
MSNRQLPTMGWSESGGLSIQAGTIRRDQRRCGFRPMAGRIAHMTVEVRGNVGGRGFAHRHAGQRGVDRDARPDREEYWSDGAWLL